MLINNKAFEPSDNIWIFFADKPFKSVRNEFTSQLSEFLEKWQSHGKDLACNYEIKEDIFLAIITSNNYLLASGCSIDLMKNTINKLYSNFNLQLQNNGMIPNKYCGTLNFTPFLELKKMAFQNLVAPKTIIYNTGISNYKQWKDSFETTFDESWLGKNHNHRDIFSGV